MKAYLKMDDNDIIKLLAKELLCQKGLCRSQIFSNVTVSRDEEIGGHKIECLESDGLIFLSPSPGSVDGEMLLSIPYFTLHILQPKFSNSTPPKLMRSTSTLLASRDNEILDLSVILMKLDLLQQLGNSTFKLSDVFPLHSQARDTEFNIPAHLKFIEIREQVRKWSHQKFSSLLKDMENEHCGAVGTGNDNFPDAWLVVRTPNDVRYVLYIQSKRRTQIGASLTPAISVTDEHAKCTFLPQRHIFVFITDDRGRDQQYQENEIIVTSDVHAKFYGKCVALRKSHMM